MSIKTKLKVYFRNRFYKKLKTEDLRAYKAILRFLYHKEIEVVLKHPKSPRYYLRVDSLDLDLVIEPDKAEFVNGSHIYPLQVDNKVLERAVFLIEHSVELHREGLEIEIRGRKNNILQQVYNKIK